MTNTEENNYYKYIKLLNGETIICETDYDCSDWYDRRVISLINPVQINQVRLPRQEAIIESYILIPWVSFSVSDVIEIPTSNILVILDPKIGLIKNYLEFIMRYNVDEVKSEIEAEHGTTEDLTVDEYLDSILEEITTMEQDDDGQIEEPARERRTRILH